MIGTVKGREDHQVHPAVLDHKVDHSHLKEEREELLAVVVEVETEQRPGKR